MLDKATGGTARRCKATWFGVDNNDQYRRPRRCQRNKCEQNGTIRPRLDGDLAPTYLGQFLVKLIDDLFHTSPFMVTAHQAPTTLLPSLRPHLYKDFHTRYRNSATLRYGYRRSRRPSHFSTTWHRRLYQSVSIYCPFETRCYCESKTISIAFSLPNLLFAPHLAEEHRSVSLFS
jgi:hypothetical protein